MRFLALLLCLWLVQPLFAQSSVNADLDFLLTKIRKDYAGYRDKVNEKEFAALVSQVTNDTSKDRFYSLSQITAYFKDDHLALFAGGRLTAKDTLESRANLVAIRHHTQIPHARKQPLEGYYINDLNTCVVYIRPELSGGWGGYVIESREPVPPGFRVFRLHNKGKARYFADFTDPHALFRVVIDAWLKNGRVLVGGSYFQFGPCSYAPGMLAKMPAFNYDPSLASPDSQTVLIRMPDFEPENKNLYDSLFKANSIRLDHAKTLILDVRNNAGGVINCFMPLLDYVCNGPFPSISAWQLCSEDLIEDARSDLRAFREKKDSASIAVYEEYIAGMEQHKDSFRLYGDRQLSCEYHPNQIRHIAILTNHGTRSAAEMMILYFKRVSSRVCLFGENSRGAIDYLDLLSFKLPVSGYGLWVGSSKRNMTAAQPAYELTGIPPDIRIPSNEPDWVGFVQRYYRRKDRR